MIEIADEANAYGIFIGPITRCSSAVGAGYLSSPAKCYFNLAVTAVSPITYHKIVANSIPVVLFTVHLVKDGCISGFCRRMMYHDGRPLLFNRGGG